MTGGSGPPLSLEYFAGSDISRLAKVSSRLEKGLRSRGIGSLLDLLTTYPRRYHDRTRQAAINELVPGDEATVVAEIRSVQSVPGGRGHKGRVVTDVTDGTGTLRVTFFNQPWRSKSLREGDEVVVFGKVDLFRGRRQMTNPVVDTLGDRTRRIVPIYPQSEKARIETRDMERIVGEVLRRAAPKGFAEPIPEELRRRHGLVDRATAFRAVHLPETFEEIELAQNRLKFEELLRIQLTLVLRKRLLEREGGGIEHLVDGGLVRRFHDRLPFALTAAQERVISEIAADLARPVPMHRLLQGEVGSGKTIVAVTAALVAIQGGHQAALMAPTEVLAEQHALNIREMLAGLTVDAGADGSLFAEREVGVALLTNRTPAARRQAIAAGLADGTVDLLIGTHALIQESVAFRSLGVVVIDEQHRFGVEQRAALRDKGTVPDVLVMTATPIPRTAAMTVYGDLDESILDELPPGRTPVVTRWARTPEEEGEAWADVRSEVSAGRRAFVVCPLIEESDKLQVASAQETFDRLTAPGGELEGLAVGLLHGRLPGREKEATFDLFRRGRLDVLVATTVIEVGVDVAEATVMVILDADRFGLAQLHQLRGRVGRGEWASTCWIMGEATSERGEERLQGFVKESDGFVLAELDLEIRGEGTLFGEKQTGRTDLKLASLRRDRGWVEKAREAAFELVDPERLLADHPVLAGELRTVMTPEDAEYLLKS
jgi:ATP-dependent DNA helicase RecG